MQEIITKEAKLGIYKGNWTYLRRLEYVCLLELQTCMDKAISSRDDVLKCRRSNQIMERKRGSNKLHLWKITPETNK